jgi:hypothetical protein
MYLRRGPNYLEQLQPVLYACIPFLTLCYGLARPSSRGPQPTVEESSILLACLTLAVYNCPPNIDLVILTLAAAILLWYCSRLLQYAPAHEAQLAALNTLPYMETITSIKSKVLKNTWPM